MKKIRKSFIRFDENNYRDFDQKAIHNKAFELNEYYRKLAPNLYFFDLKSTYKPAAFWPKYYYFLYVFNSFDSKEAVLATNSLLNKDWINSWNYSYISGSKDMLFTTAFWWKKTNTIYFIGEKKHKPRNGYVFKFDPKDLR